MSIVILNYAMWFISVFMAVVWILVLFENRRHMGRPGTLKKLPRVSVLIPVYNEEKTAVQTVRSVLNLDYPAHLLEVIVINDASTDRTPQKLRRFVKQGRIRLLAHQTNRGKAAALNTGLSAARGELIACIDADSRVEPGILKKMIGYFGRRRVACVTPALKVWRHDTLLEKIQYAEYVFNIFLRKMLALIDSVHVTPGVFSVYRARVLKRLGGFDEGNLTEDMEIALRIHRAGYTIENALDASSYTVCPDTWKELFRQRIRWYRGALQNLVKYRGMFFNPKYGNLGMFFLPLNMMSVFAVMAIFVLLASNYLRLAVDMVWKFSLVHWDVGVFVGAVDGSRVMNALVEMIASPIFFAIVGLALGGYLLAASFGITREKASAYKKGYLLYLFVYPFIMMTFWFLALLHEVGRKKRKW